MTPKAKVVNFVGFQLGWLACVLGAARGFPWMGPGAAAVLAGLHFWLHPNPKGEAKVLGAALLAGLLVDGGMIALGAYEPLAPGPRFFGLPLWLWALWPCFATTLNASLGWLKPHPLWGVAFGLAGGPMAYYAGERLGAVALDPNWLFSMGALGIAWGIATPALLAMAECLSPAPAEPLAETPEA